MNVRRLQRFEALARGVGVEGRAALEADFGRSFDLVLSDKSLWQSRDGAS